MNPPKLSQDVCGGGVLVRHSMLVSLQYPRGGDMLARLWVDRLLISPFRWLSLLPLKMASLTFPPVTTGPLPSATPRDGTDIPATLEWMSQGYVPQFALSSRMTLADLIGWGRDQAEGELHPARGPFRYGS